MAEGTAARLTDRPTSPGRPGPMLEVYDWPTTVVGNELDAPYAAPTSGGPPFRAYEVTPVRVFAFPTNDDFDATQRRFGGRP